MIYASNKEGEKVSPTPNTHAFCPGCKTEVQSKCGDINIWHWAHLQKPNTCMYKPITQWHLEHQTFAERKGWELEKRIAGKEGDNYRIADCIKGKNVIELQESSITDDEIIRRNIYYRMLGLNIHWVFDFKDKRDIYLHYYDLEEGTLKFKQNHPRKSILILFNYIRNQNKPIWGNVFLEIYENEYIMVKKMYTDEEGRGSGNGWGKMVDLSKLLRICERYHDELMVTQADKKEGLFDF